MTTMTTTPTMMRKTMTTKNEDDWWEEEARKQKEFWDWFNNMNREIEGEDYEDINTTKTTIETVISNCDTYIQSR